MLCYGPRDDAPPTAYIERNDHCKMVISPVFNAIFDHCRGDDGVECVRPDANGDLLYIGPGLDQLRDMLMEIIADASHILKFITATNIVVKVDPMTKMIKARLAKEKE